MRHSRRQFLKTGLTVGGAALFGAAASGTAAADRSYGTDFDLTTHSNLTGAEIDDTIDRVHSGSPLVGLGSTFVDVEQEHDINAVYQAAHAAWESAWGESSIAREKNNIYGWSAYDSCPSACAKSFDSYADCVRYVMPRIDDLYLTPGGTYYTDYGPTLRGMNVNYATDPNWAEGIAGVMSSLGEYFGDRRRDPDGGRFADGDRVATTADLSVRAGPGTGYEVQTVASDGSAGYVRDGPRYADGYTWWKVAYNAGYVGWSAGNWLESAPKSSGGGNGGFDDNERVATTAELVIHEWPGLEYDTVEVAPAGATGYVRNGPWDRDGYTWWKVDFNAGYSGYCVGKYLDSAPIDTTKLDIGQTVATTTDLSVRTRPDLQSDRVAVAEQGTTGQIKNGIVTEDGYTWWKVAYDTGETGWSVQQYLTDDLDSVGGADFSYPLGGRITSDWYDQRSYGYHKSLDIASPSGAPIVAARSGTVQYTTRLDAGGLTVYLNHGDGYQSLYMHCSDFAVTEGESVERGDTIAYCGETGHATGPHLHFEIQRDGNNQFIPGEKGTVVEQGGAIDEDYPGL